MKLDTPLPRVTRCITMGTLVEPPNRTGDEARALITLDDGDRSLSIAVRARGQNAVRLASGTVGRSLLVRGTIVDREEGADYTIEASELRWV